MSTTGTQLVRLTPEVLAELDQGRFPEPTGPGKHRIERVSTRVITAEQRSAAVQPNPTVAVPLPARASVSVEPVRQRLTKLAFMARNIAGRFRP